MKAQIPSTHMPFNNFQPTTQCYVICGYYTYYNVVHGENFLSLECILYDSHKK
jgi:hypothetical protein